MLQSWRWYGPNDPVLLDHIRQAGATDIVTAMHENYDGQTWSYESIVERRDLIKEAGLKWSTVESIPVAQAIKLTGSGAVAEIKAYKQTMRNLAKAGIWVICYNFMPVVDWTRTDLRFVTPTGGLALRFDAIDFAAYDIFILERLAASDSYTDAVVKEAKARHGLMTDAEIITLESNIISGLPGSELNHTRAGVRAAISEYDGIGHAELRDNLIAFQNEIIPLAEELGLRMCIHPDDPPFSLFGLPRVVSTIDDYRAMFKAVPSLANGVTFGVGSLGSRADNDLAAMVKELAPRIHFAHLRSVLRDAIGGFYESDHLEGSSSMIEIVDLLQTEERRRQDQGRSDREIPMRPDHGHLLLDDVDKKTNTGYSAIGRLKGLAELRGVMAALDYKHD